MILVESGGGTLRLKAKDQIESALTHSQQNIHGQLIQTLVRKFPGS